MKKLLILVAALAVLAPAALAAEVGSQGTSPAQACKTELNTLGAATFKSLYAPTGNNAMGKCVSKHQQSAAANRVNAAKACKAEQEQSADTFKAAHGGKTFGEFYGKNENDRNAYGKCVSSKASKADAQQEAALLNAAKTCKKERDADRTAFTAKYGGKASSAFGKCVSSKSNTK
jgi:hypothetical protein